MLASVLSMKKAFKMLIGFHPTFLVRLVVRPRMAIDLNPDHVSAAYSADRASLLRVQVVRNNGPTNFGQAASSVPISTEASYLFQQVGSLYYFSFYKLIFV
jgi:hypothetical protein